MKSQMCANNIHCSAGSLPATWGQQGAFPALSSLDLSGLPLLNGSLPSSWGGFPSLTALELGECPLTGTLPAEWGSPTAFQQLQSLSIHDTAISAAVPASWGSRSAFPQLLQLSLMSNWPGTCQQTAPGNANASAVVSNQPGQSLYPSFLNSLYPEDGFSNSSASNHEGAWSQLQALILYNNCLRGSIPPSWGAPGITAVQPSFTSRAESHKSCIFVE